MLGEVWIQFCQLNGQSFFETISPDCFSFVAVCVEVFCTFDFVIGSFGVYLPSSIELPTTVTELRAIAIAANIGNHPNISTPNTGTNTPPAMGINPVL